MNILLPILIAVAFGLGLPWIAVGTLLVAIVITIIILVSGGTIK